MVRSEDVSIFSINIIVVLTTALFLSFIDMNIFYPSLNALHRSLGCLSSFVCEQQHTITLFIFRPIFIEFNVFHCQFSDWGQIRRGIEVKYKLLEGPCAYVLKTEVYFHLQCKLRS